MSIYIDGVIARLKEIRIQEGNLEFCRVGHYGGIFEMSLYDIYACDAREGVFGNGKKHRVVSIEVPDIGPEPD